VLPIWKSGINHHFLYFITKKIYLKRYNLANIIIVLLSPTAAICRSENDWEKNNGTLIWLINLFLFVYNNFFILIMKFRNINLLNHFMINDQYKLDSVDRLVNCKTIKCNYVHYFMIISNYLFFDQTISCIKKFKYS
jgi:hypothetical protein